MRLDKLTPFYVMQILKEAQDYPNAIHLEIGQPDLPPSPKVAQALHAAIDEQHFSYTQTEGLYELRSLIAKHYKLRYNLTVDPDQILLTPGSSGAFLLAYSLTLDISQTLSIADPGYPSYKNFAAMLGIKPKFLNVTPSTNYCITPDMMGDTHALQISNPANPTGTIYERELLKELAQKCDREGIWLISDELYHGLTYEEQPACAREFSERAIVISGFSKYFCMPGLRLGWIILPHELVDDAIKLAQNIFLSAPTLSQYAALQAFDYAYLKSVTQTFHERRDYLYAALREFFDIPTKPQGAFYIWADVRRYSDDSFAFAKHLLQKIQVATTPGIDFGQNETHRFIRFSFTQPLPKLKEAMERLASLLG